MLVDAHAHVFAPASASYPRATSATFPADSQALAGDFLDTLDRAGVDRAVVIPLSAGDRYVADCLRRWPDRLTGIAVHDPDSRAPVDQVRRDLAADGMSGLRMFSLGPRAGKGDPADPSALTIFPLLAALEADGLKLSLYPREADLELLGAVAAALPGLPVILNHLGFCSAPETLERRAGGVRLPPPTFPAVLGLARHQNVFVGFSGMYAFSARQHPFRDLAGVVEGLHRAYGAARMLWGSDYPMTLVNPGYARSLEGVRALLPGIADDAYSDILGGTAARLFRM